MSKLNSRIDSLSPAKRAVLEKRLKQKVSGSALSASISKRPSTAERLPSSSQRRLWFIHQLAPKSPAYNRPTHFRLIGKLQTEALIQSLNELVARHRVLRTVFESVEGQPLCKVMPAVQLTVPLADLSELSEKGKSTEKNEQVQQQAIAFTKQPFELEKGPLIRAKLLRLSESEHILLVSIHHIVFDGWSAPIFQRELAALYEAAVTERPAELPDLPIQYDDFSHWQQQSLSQTALKAQLDYWRTQL
ncbi:MAG: condensation domain-containing protein, partial [Cyanobacteria bacterium J06632_3]